MSEKYYGLELTKKQIEKMGWQAKQDMYALHYFKKPYEDITIYISPWFNGENSRLTKAAGICIYKVFRGNKTPDILFQGKITSLKDFKLIIKLLEV